MKVSPALEAQMLAAGATVRPAGSFGLLPLLPLTVLVACVVASEANLKQHWAIRLRRKQAQQKAVLVALSGLCGKDIRGPLVVTMTRLIGPAKGKARPQRMDDDNLASAFKSGIRDTLAAWLGRDDGDGTVEWVCQQERAAASGVRVEVRK